MIKDDLKIVTKIYNSKNDWRYRYIKSQPRISLKMKKLIWINGFAKLIWKNWSEKLRDKIDLVKRKNFDKEDVRN